MPTAAAPPPTTSAPRRRRRGISAWLSEKPEKRAVQVAILATVLVHLLLLLWIPTLFRTDPMMARPKRGLRVLNMRLAPLARKPAPRPTSKPIPKYVETNPNAPENVPDHTNNISNRNQQSAQEKASKIQNTDMPAQEGRKNFKNDQIVDGRLSRPQQEEPQPEPITPPKPPSKALPRAQQTPLEGFDRTKGANPLGYGSNIAKPSDHPRPIDRAIDGVANAPLIDAPNFAQPQVDRRHPRQRRSLDVHSRPAIIAENVNGTSRVGVTGRDARWSNYGAYLNRLEEAVQVTWDDVMEHAPYPAPGSTVTVTFVLNSAGEISKIAHVESTANEIGTRACETALTRPSPYGKWTDDMIAIFGTEQELTFTFYYE